MASISFKSAGMINMVL